jgi:hypothetical protein
MRAASSEYFIVKPKSTDFPQGLPIQQVGSTGLFILRSPSAGQAASAQWDSLVQQFGDQLDFIAPVMFDDRGRQQLPTGKIVVQFDTPPSDETLHNLEETYGLRCLKTNEFKREQATFEMVDHAAAYPPQLIASLENEPNVKFATPEVLVGFSRG